MYKIITVFAVSVLLLSFWNETVERELCYEVLLQDTIVLDQAASLYFKSEKKWAPRAVPPIFECPQEQMQKLNPTAEGLYINETILISDKSGIFDGDIYAWSVIVHELVHSLQDLDGKMLKVKTGEMKTCDLENEAYAIQEKYLEDARSIWAVDQSDECKKAKLVPAESRPPASAGASFAGGIQEESGIPVK